MKHTVISQRWIESERGWGTRPDGVSLHLTEGDRDQFICDYWSTMPQLTPDIYSRPEASFEYPQEFSKIEVSDETYQKIVDSRNGLRIWEHQVKDYDW